MSQSKFDDRKLSIVFSRATRLTKIGFIGVKRDHIPKWCACFCFIISNLQTIALLLGNSRLFLPKQNDIATDIIDAYRKIFGFADWFSYTNSISVTIWTIVNLFGILSFFVLFAYINIKLARRTLIPEMIQQYWSLMGYFHPLAMFYPVHTFTLKAINNYYLDNYTDPLKKPILIILYVVLITNVWIAYVNTQVFQVIIKTKDVLSSKTNIVRTKDIITKTIVPILWCASEHSDDNETLFTVILFAMVIDCALREAALFYYLPYYNVQILQISAVMQGAISTLAVLTLITKGLSQSDLELGQFFLHTTWVLFIPLVAKGYSAYLWRVFRFIMGCRPSDVHVHYASHKGYILRHLMKKRKAPTSDTRIFDMDYFLFGGKMAQIQEWKGMEKTNLGVTKDDFGKIMNDFSVGITQQYPKSHLAKAILADYYVRKEGAYLLANNLIEEVLNDAPSFPTRISLSLIRFELQKKLYQQYSQHGSDEKGLNLLGYIQVNAMTDQLKQKIKHQVRKQIEFWDNFLSSSPDMGTLTDLALKVGQERKDVANTWRELVKARPYTFYSPPLIYGMYISLANNDGAEGEKFIEQYHQDVIRSSKALEVDDLNNDTMMAEDTVQISMSGSRTKIGYILDCSANITQLYGWKKEFLVKQPIIAIMPPYYQQKHDRFLMNHYNTGKTKLLNNTSYLPVVGSDGYIRPSRVHIKMHPFVEQGISYVAVMRRIKEPRRWVLVRRDGTIDGMSKNFSTDMNIFTKDQVKNLSILTLCPGFRAVNSAFNMKALKMIRENSSHNLKQGSGHQLASSRHNHQSPSSSRFSRHSGLDLNHTHDSEYALGQAEDEFSSHITMKNIKGALEMSLSHFQDTESRAHALYEAFSTTGSKLAFIPQKTYMLNGNQIKLFTESQQGVQTQPILYNVTILTRIHEKEFIKVVYLDRLSGDDPQAATGPAEFMNMSQRNSIISNKPLVLSRVPSEEKQLDQPIIDPFSGRMTSNRPLMSPSALHESIRHQEKRRSIFAQERSGSAPVGIVPMNAADKIYGIELHETEPYEKSFNENENENGENSQDASIPEEDIDNNNDNNTNRRGIGAEEFIQTNSKSPAPILSPEDLFSSARQDLISTIRNDNGDSPLLKKAPVGESPTKKEEPEQDPLGKISQVTFAAAKPGGKTRFGKVVDQVIKHRTNSLEYGKLRSITEEHIKEPLQEENLLRKKLKKLRERLNKGILDIGAGGKNEGSIASSYLSRGKKVQSLLVRALDVVVYKRPAVVFASNFFFFILVILIIQIYEAVAVDRDLTQITAKLNVIENGAFRMNSFITLAMYSRLWLEILQGHYTLGESWEEDNGSMSNMSLLALGDAIKYNNEIWQQVTEIDEKFQLMFYNDTVRMYENKYTVNKILIGTYTNFEAAALLIDYSTRFITTGYPSSFEPDINVEGLQFYLDNFYGDFLMTSMMIIQVLASDLETTFDDTDRDLLIAYLFLVGNAILFLFSILRYLYSMRKDSARFMHLFFRLDTKEVNEIKHLLRHFIDTLDSNVHDIEELDDDKKPEIRQKAKDGNTKRVHFKEASMGKLYRTQILGFTRLLPYYVIMAIWTLSYYLITKNIFHEVNKQKNQIQSTVEILFNNNALVTEFIEFMTTNGTTQVRNAPIINIVLQNLDEIKEINSFINQFRDDDGNLDGIQRQIFNGFPCEEFAKYNFQPADLLVEGCNAQSKGTGMISYTSVASEIYTIITTFYTEYQASTKTQDELIQLFNGLADEFQNLAVLTAPLCTLLYQTARINFENQVDMTRTTGIAFSSITVVAILLGAVGVWFLVIQRMFRIEATDKDVLRMVPIRLILANQYLKQYLLQNSNRLLDNVKSIL